MGEKDDWMLEVPLPLTADVVVFEILLGNINRPALPARWSGVVNARGAANIANFPPPKIELGCAEVDCRLKASGRVEFFLPSFCSPDVLSAVDSILGFFAGGLLKNTAIFCP
jgi:hypothetical protein